MHTEEAFYYGNGSAMAPYVNSMVNQGDPSALLYQQQQQVPLLLSGQEILIDLDESDSPANDDQSVDSSAGKQLSGPVGALSLHKNKPTSNHRRGFICFYM